MPFKCGVCGLSFDAAEEFMNHKLVHQKESQKPEKKGVICLGCGNPIPTDPSTSNYSGEIICSGCGQTMKVILEDGEVVFAMSKGVTVQTGEDLLRQYHKWVIEYVKAKELIDNLVPVPANLSEGGEMPTITVTEDLMARFQYAEATMANALRKRQEIHEKLHKLQHNR
ncbi:hypothetical protein ACFLW2_02700 [Chloroflexota bacterium]